jgi:hypothetical protein
LVDSDDWGIGFGGDNTNKEYMRIFCKGDAFFYLGATLSFL